MALKVGELFADLNLRDRQFQQGIKRTQRSVQQVSRSFVNLNRIVAGLTLGVAARLSLYLRQRVQVEPESACNA